MKILGTGLNGLVGSRIVELLSSSYQFENISRSEGIDIANSEQVHQKISSSDASVVLHLAAKSNVDACEKDKTFGKEGETWKTNVLGTKNIADACLQAGKKLIYVSTDFVFNGNDTPEDGYSEEDVPDPINWYAMTKYEGEKIVTNLSTPWVILRLAYPYRAAFVRNDFFRAIKNRLEENKKTQVISDYLFTPTFIDDFAGAIDSVIQKDAEGIFHAVGSRSLHPYDAAMHVAEVFHLDKGLLTKISGEAYFANAAKRPFNLTIKNDKIKGIGVTIKTFEEGIAEIKKQLQ